MCLHQPVALRAAHPPPSETLPQFIERGIELAHLERPYRPLTPGNDNPNLSSTRVLTEDDFRADYYRFHEGPFWVVGDGVPIGLHPNWDNAKAASQGYSGSPGARRREVFDDALKYYLQILYNNNVHVRNRAERRAHSTPSSSPRKAGYHAYGTPSSRASTQEPSTPHSSAQCSSHASTPVAPATPRPVQSPGHSADNPILLYTPTPQPPRVNLATKPKPTPQHPPSPAALTMPAGAGSPASPTVPGIGPPPSPTPASKSLKRKNDGIDIGAHVKASSPVAGPSSAPAAKVVDNSDEAYRRLPGYPTPLGAAISSLTGYSVSSHTSTPATKRVVEDTSPNVPDDFDYSPQFFTAVAAIEAKAYMGTGKSHRGSGKGKRVDRSDGV